jgi:hypothetical protein
MQNNYPKEISEPNRSNMLLACWFYNLNEIMIPQWSKSLLTARKEVSFQTARNSLRFALLPRKIGFV